MPENNVPSAKPDPEVAPGEFDFAQPVSDRPRVKRRALQQATTTKPVEIVAEKVETPVRPAAAAPSPTPSTPASKPATSTTASSLPASASAAVKPKTAASSQPTSPHGTRPATLYYSSGSRQDKATPAPSPTTSPSPMKTTPSASPSPSPAATSTTVPRATTAAATPRPSSVVDYRTNVDRQSREQKSVGGILTILVYALIFLFVSGACLATYGMYIITKQLNQQSVTMSDFDKRYSSDYKDVNSRLVLTMDNLTQAQAQIAKQQDLIAKQQDALTKLLAATTDNADALKQERATRAQETASLRSRLKDLEYQGTTTRKY